MSRLPAVSAMRTCADRQPEFTQLDLEMSFVEANDIMEIIDGLTARLASEILGQTVKLPLPRMTYDEAMERFGADAPDLRFGMELIDCTDLAAACEFRVFQGVASAGGRVRGINAKGAAASYSRKRIDELTDYVTHDFGARGSPGSRLKKVANSPRPSARTSAKTCSAVSPSACRPNRATCCCWLRIGGR